MVPENTEDRPIIFHFRNSSTFHLVRGKTFYMKIWKGQWIEWLRLHWGNLPSSTSGMCKYTLIYFKFARKLSNDVTTFLLFSFFSIDSPQKMSTARWCPGILLLKSCGYTPGSRSNSRFWRNCCTTPTWATKHVWLSQISYTSGALWALMLHSFIYYYYNKKNKQDSLASILWLPVV